MVDLMLYDIEKLSTEAITFESVLGQYLSSVFDVTRQDYSFDTIITQFPIAAFFVKSKYIGDKTILLIP
jgi:hypothetical protein